MHDLGQVVAVAFSEPKKLRKVLDKPRDRHAARQRASGPIALPKTTRRPDG